MTHNPTPTPDAHQSAPEFAERARHFAATAQGLATYQCENAADRATVRALLDTAVKAGAAQ